MNQTAEHRISRLSQLLMDTTTKGACLYNENRRLKERIKQLEAQLKKGEAK